MEDDVNFFQIEFKFKSEPILEKNVDIESNDWYYQHFTRIEAENFLYEKPEGCFLVRKSVRGNYSLSVKYGDEVLHFKIFEDVQGKFSLWTAKFNSLVELIDHYKEAAITGSSNVKLRDLPRTKDTLQVVGKYDFRPQREGDLAFKKGEVITVINETDENWWEGRIGARQGKFPSTYVTSFNSAP